MGKPSLANGLAVPNPFGEDLILEVLKQSGGLPIAISDEAMIKCVKQLAKGRRFAGGTRGWRIIGSIAPIDQERKNSTCRKNLIIEYRFSI